MEIQLFLLTMSLLYGKKSTFLRRLTKVILTTILLIDYTFYLLYLIILVTCYTWLYLVLFILAIKLLVMIIVINLIVLLVIILVINLIVILVIILVINLIVILVINLIVILDYTCLLLHYLDTWLILTTKSFQVEKRKW